MRGEDIPIVFGALFLFQATLYLGKPDDYVASKRWNLLYLPALLIVGAIMTNDLHSLAFRFVPGFVNWQADYTHGPVYFAAVGWIALTLIGSIILVIKSTISRRLLKTAWLPLLVLLVAVLFGGYFSGNKPILAFLSVVNFPDYVCLSTILVWESLVAARIIVTNSDYPAIFAASSLSAGLTDSVFQVRQTSTNAIVPSPEMLQKARNGELLPDGDTLLKVRPVQGGWFYWTEDVAELRRLNEALDNVGEELAEENNMLRAMSDMDESRRITAAKIRLYDDVNESLRPQLQTVSAWMDDLPAKEEAFCGVLQRTAVLLTYCKRRSVLLLQANDHPVLTGDDIYLCLSESAKALSLLAMFGLRK